MRRGTRNRVILRPRSGLARTMAGADLVPRLLLSAAMDALAPALALDDDDLDFDDLDDGADDLDLDADVEDDDLEIEDDDLALDDDPLTLDDDDFGLDEDF